MRALVTGGAGFIGSHLVDALVEQGHQVAVIDNLSTGREENLAGAVSSGAVLHRIDIQEGERVREQMAADPPEVVFHLAAQIDVRRSVADPGFDARTNVEGTINLLETAREVGVKRFVFSSTGGAIYGETDQLPSPETLPPKPEAPYGMSKYCGERCATETCTGPARTRWERPAWWPSSADAWSRAARPRCSGTARRPATTST
jgi:UDP-glucose 4-epimerase